MRISLHKRVDTTRASKRLRSRGRPCGIRPGETHLWVHYRPARGYYLFPASQIVHIYQDWLNFPQLITVAAGDDREEWRLLPPPLLCAPSMQSGSWKNVLNLLELGSPPVTERRIRKKVIVVGLRLIGPLMFGLLVSFQEDATFRVLHAAKWGDLFYQRKRF